MEAEAPERVSSLIWLLQKRNRFLCFSESDHTGKVQAPRKTRSHQSKSIFSKLLLASFVKEAWQKNFHGKRYIKEQGCMGGAISQGRMTRTHRPDVPCPRLLPPPPTRHAGLKIRGASKAQLRSYAEREGENATERGSLTRSVGSSKTLQRLEKSDLKSEQEMDF